MFTIKTSADNAPRNRTDLLARPGRTNLPVSSSFNTVGDRSELRQYCRSRLLWIVRLLSLHSSHASPHRCSRVSLLKRH